MKPTEVLMHEHQIILLVLKGVEREANAIATTGIVNTERVAEVVDFFRNFTDKCHHGKEEKHLFPRMEERGIPREGGPIGVMLLEHEEGRGFVRRMAELIEKPLGDESVRLQLSDAMLGYVELLRSHIDKENEILFPMGDSVLSETDQKELAEAFDKVEAEEMGEGVHEKYHELAHRLGEG